MNSIKESFDNLPVAVCFFDKRGVVRLMNRRMLSVGAELLGSGVQTLEELHRALDTPPESIERLDAEMGVYKFPSGTVLRFVERQITDKSGGSYTEVTASDVTRLVTLQQELRKERCSNQSFNLFAVSRQLSALVAETNAGSKRKMFLMTFAIWIGAEVFRTDIQRCAAVGTELSVRTNSGTATRTDRHL